jgi:hypothetical protein
MLELTPDASYSFRTHAASHGVTHETARNDLLPLVNMGLLEQRRHGREYAFAPALNLPELLKVSNQQRR